MQGNNYYLCTNFCGLDWSLTAALEPRGTSVNPRAAPYWSRRSSSRAWKREAASIADHVIASFVRWDGKRPDNDFSCCFLFLFSQEEIYVCSPQFDLIPLSRASCSFYFWRSFTVNQIFKKISSKQYKRPSFWFSKCSRSHKLDLRKFFERRDNDLQNLVEKTKWLSL